MYDYSVVLDYSQISINYLCRTAKAAWQRMVVFMVGGDSGGDDGRGVGAEMC